MVLGILCTRKVCQVCKVSGGAQPLKPDQRSQASTLHEKNPYIPFNIQKTTIIMTSNYPSANPQNPEPKKDNRGLIYGVLIAALLGTWGYIIFDKSKTKEMIQQKDNQYAQLDSSKNTVQKEYEDALLRLDAMTSSNSHLDSLVKSKDAELTSLKGRIKGLVGKQNATAADLAEARKLIGELNGKVDGYLKQIEQLQAENQQLTQDKAQLTTQKAQLESNLSNTQAEKKAAEDKVDIGSTLHASNFQISAINVKNNGKEKSGRVGRSCHRRERRPRAAGIRSRTRSGLRPLLQGRTTVRAGDRESGGHARTRAGRHAESSAHGVGAAHHGEPVASR